MVNQHTVRHSLLVQVWISVFTVSGVSGGVVGERKSVHGQPPVAKQRRYDARRGVVVMDYGGFGVTLPGATQKSVEPVMWRARFRAKTDHVEF